ncbi:putative ATPase [Nocardiopsis sp. Huas11]|uniref:BTAD domain-containing putative transcriptional regulator n=1 Tax=Nocardiopsis sp. Huas11 TaxID=2183912 RepID=UPI000EB2E142|nr:BTAD domain-containing putative transcriptional regulator [Nocardiopsis sp. Huas11]RKS09095.1 putative ATPase [Nocardiopsis sp. Huas11]
MRFGVLGPLAVWTDQGRPVEVRDTKVRALLVSLLLARGATVSADRLVQDLWGDRPPAKPLPVLQARVSQLRGALDRAEPGSRDLLRRRAPGYALAAADLDLARFDALLARAARAADPRPDLAGALDLWRGPALAEFADTDHVRAAVAAWEEQRATALEDLAEARLAAGEHSALAAELAAAAERHPYRERLHAAHIRALYGAGRQAEALAAYARLRVRLADDMGVDPGPDLLALHRAVLAQDPALDPVPRPARPTGNLPAPTGALVGREEELSRLGALVREHRLVTLTGPGGVGKTRMALAAGHAWAHGRGTAHGGDGATPAPGRGPESGAVGARSGAARSAAGRGCATGAVPDAGGAVGAGSGEVWFVELAPLPAGSDPAAALAAVLGARDDQRAGDPLDQAAGLLRGRAALLVLDNCEHLVGPAADAVAHLLRAAPDLTVLATSRAPLDLADEHLYAVPPLAPPPLGAADPATLADSGAVRLFVTRARAAVSAFTLDEETAPAVATVCRRLDGIPLALELAATRLRHMSAAELAARLDDRFTLLDVGRRDAPARQRTLWAMIDWSWELLDATERTVLTRLAVHRDGCDLATAEAVCADHGPAPGGPERAPAVPATAVLGVIGALVDRSLVTATAHPTGTRYHLLESVAAYALERLERSGHAHQARDRHARHFADLAERADELLRGADQPHWLDRLDCEAANLRAALDFAAAEGRTDLALRVATAQCWHHYLRGRTARARAALDTALALPGGRPPLRAAAHVWRAALAAPGSEDDRRGYADLPRALDAVTDPATRARLAWLTEHTRWALGDLRPAAERVERARAAAAAAGDAWTLAQAQVTLAQAAFLRGDLAESLRLAMEGRRSLRALGDRWGLLRASDTLAQALEALGDLEGAAEHHREGLPIAEELGLWSSAGLTLSGLGRIAMLTGDLDRADVLLTRAGRLAAERSDAVGEQFADAGIALVARRRGDLDRAERSLRRWLDWNRRTSGRVGLAFILTQLGYTAEQRGDADGALELHTEAEAEARASGDPRAVALALEGLAGAHALAGDRDQADDLLKRAAALRDEVGAPLIAAERFDVDRAVARLERDGA